MLKKYGQKKITLNCFLICFIFVCVFVSQMSSRDDIIFIFRGTVPLGEPIVPVGTVQAPVCGKACGG